jgi:hypothetical protein
MVAAHAWFRSGRRTQTEIKGSRMLSYLDVSAGSMIVGAVAAGAAGVGVAVRSGLSKFKRGKGSETKPEGDKAESQTDQVFFVGGYKADEVIERYPNLQLVLNRDWTRTGAAHSLALAPLASGHDTYVCYADVVFRPSAVAGLREADGDIVLGVDTGWRDRYDGRAQRDLDRAEKIRLDRDRVLAIGTAVDTSAANAEFTGLMRLSPRGTAAVIDALDSGTLAPSATLPVKPLRGATVTV